MDCGYSSLLDAYHDGELDAQASERISRHVPQCPVCLRNLKAMEAVSRFLRDQPAPRLSMIELARLHRHLDGGSDLDLIRLAGVLSALAASLLIVSSVWLAKFPTRHATAVSPAVVVVPASDIPAWERVATNLRVEPRSQSAGDVRLADGLGSANYVTGGDLADWIASGVGAVGHDR